MKPLLPVAGALGTYGYLRLVASLTVARRYVRDDDADADIASRLRTLDAAVAAAALAAPLLVGPAGRPVQLLVGLFGASLGFNAVRYRFEIDLKQYVPTYVAGLLGGAYLPISIGLLDVGLGPFVPIDVGTVALLAFVATLAALVTRLGSAMTDSSKKSQRGGTNNDGN